MPTPLEWTQSSKRRRADITGAGSSVAAAQASVRARQLDLEFTRVTAPVSGRVSDRRVDPGNLIGGGYAAVKLMKAVSDGGLELKTTKDGKGNLNLSLKGHYDLTNTSKVPMEFYVKEAE